MPTPPTGSFTLCGSFCSTRESTLGRRAVSIWLITSTAALKRLLFLNLRQYWGCIHAGGNRFLIEAHPRATTKTDARTSADSGLPAADPDTMV